MNKFLTITQFISYVLNIGLLYVLFRATHHFGSLLAEIRKGESGVTARVKAAIDGLLGKKVA